MAFYDDVPMQDNAGNTHYPRTKYNSVYNADGTERLDNKLSALSAGATATQFEAGVDAMLKATAQSTNSVTIKAFGDKPTVDIPVQFVILG